MGTRQFTVKHYVFLLMWWLSMSRSLASKTIWLGVVFLLGFFVAGIFAEEVLSWAQGNSPSSITSFC